jgi:hypothetical protein
VVLTHAVGVLELPNFITIPFSVAKAINPHKRD